MAKKKFMYLCAILTLSVLISDVNARTRSTSHGHSGSHSHSSRSHSSSGHSHGYSGTHPSTHHASSSGFGHIQSHSYPSMNSKPSGISSSHSYPTSSGHSLSGNSGGSSAHAYPASNSLSGSGSHSGSIFQSTSNFGSTSGSASHAYPTSHQSSLSGGGSSSSGHVYSSPNIQSSFGTQHGSVQHPSVTFGTSSGSAIHSYPVSRPNSMSGGGSGTSVHTSWSSGTGGSSYPQNTYHSTNNHHTTSWGSNTQVHHINTGRPVVHHHHHYVYNPPTVIHYGSYGTHHISYPVYTGVPPPYVYEYRSSGSRYSHLLAGLALYNLGRMSATSSSQNYHRQYNPQPDEYCKFGVQYRTGNFEEMAIDCRAITYFIYEDQPQLQSHVTTNIVNQTTVTTQLMYSNSTLMEPNKVQNLNNAVNGLATNVQTQGLAAVASFTPQQILNSNGQLMPNNQQVNSVTTTTTQVMSVTDPRFAGSPVEIKPEMECYVTRNTRFTNMKKPVPCELLQKYSASSLHNSGAMIKSSLFMIFVSIAIFFY